jgi:hypothetical protein
MKTASAKGLAVFSFVTAFIVAWPSPGLGQGQKPEVLIYYANETAPDQAEGRNYETMIAWLVSSTCEKPQKCAESLRRDVRLFPAAVDLETYTIRHMLPASSSAAGAVLFTNRLVRSGKFLLFRPGWEEFQEAAFAPPQFDNYILTSNPLCVEEVFAAVLGEVAKRFDPGRHDFVLITKSHGSKTMSLVPRLAVRHEETSREEVLDVVEGTLPESQRPSWVGRLGVTKERYLTVLEAAGTNQGMVFPLVVMESCDGAIDERLQARLPANVRALCVIDRYSATYINLLYGDILQQDFAHATLAGVMRRFTSTKFTMVDHAPTRSPAVTGPRLACLLYYAPLAGWALAVAFFTARPAAVPAFRRVASGFLRSPGHTRPAKRHDLGRGKPRFESRR